VIVHFFGSIQAIKTNAEALRFAADHLRADPSFVLEAARKNREVLKYCSTRLLRDRHFVRRVEKEVNEASMLPVAEPKDEAKSARLLSQQVGEK
jgi:hypothetical protein